MIHHFLLKERDSPAAELSLIPYQVLNGGEPGGALTMKSTNGMTYAMPTRAIIHTTHNPQRSVHLGVGASSSSTSAIGNSVFPFGAKNMR